VKYQIPEVEKMCEQLKQQPKLVDAGFAALEAPATFVPNKSSPGELMALMSRKSPCYKSAIRDISAKAMEPATEVEQAMAYVDRYANMLLACCHHLESGHEIKCTIPEGGEAMVEHAKMLRHARLAGVLEQSELDSLIRRTRSDLKASLAHLSERSGWAKKYRRATRKAILDNTAKLVDALCGQKNNVLTKSERAGLRVFGDRMAKRNDLFGTHYKQTYFGRKGHRTDIPQRGFSALEAL